MSTRSVLVIATLVLVLVLAGTWLIRSSEAPSQVAGSVDDRGSTRQQATVELAHELEPSAGPDRLEIDAGTPTSVTSQLTASEAVLQVRVVSTESQQPLVRVEVSLAGDGHLLVGVRRADLGYDGKGKLYTDEQGYVAFVVPAEERLHVSARGLRNHAGQGSITIGPIAAGTRSEIVIELETAWKLPFYGRVRSASDGTPVPDAHVALGPGEFASNDGVRAPAKPALRETRSDIQGFFEFRLLDWNPWHTARIEREGFAHVLIPITAGHDTPETALEVRLEASAFLRARIVDGQGRGRGAHVLVLTALGEDLMRAQGVEKWYGGPSVAVWKSTTSTDGTCEIEDLPPNVPLGIEVQAEGRVLPRKEETLSLAPGERREIEIAVIEGMALRGRVLEKNAPLAGQEVWLVEAQREGPRNLVSFDRPAQKTTSDQHGRFGFDQVLPGAWWIGPAAPDEHWDGSGVAPVLSIPEVVEVLSGVDPREVVLRVERGSTIRGRVLSSSGEPLSVVTVLASSRAPLCFLRTASREDGAFVIGPLAAGEYALFAAATRDHAQSAEVRAPAGASDVVLRMQPGATIDGVVLDASSRAPCAADMALVSGKDARFFARPSRAQQGRFEYAGLEGGEYTLAARTADGRFGSVHGIAVAPGARRTDIAVAVEPGAKLRLIGSGKGFARVEIWAGGVCVGVEGVRGGANEIVTVPAGALSLRTRGATPTETQQDVTVPVGEERTATVATDR